MYYINLDIDVQERYDLSKFMVWEDNMYDILTSNFIISLKSLNPTGVFEVTYEENRPDLVSYNIFKTTNYWALLMMYNDMISPFEIKIGVQMAFPGIKDLEDLYFTLRSKEMAESS